MYFKITNKNENHYGYQYKDGLNVLDKEFDDNPVNHCSEGGLYFATKEHIHEFYDFGIYLRVIELPLDDPDFKIVKDENKYRANKIILKEKYSLDDIKIYNEFSLKYPILSKTIKNGYYHMAEYLLDNNINIDKEGNDNLLWWCIATERIEMAELLIKKGANIHNYCDLLRFVLKRKLTESIKFLMKEKEIVESLVEKKANIYVYGDFMLQLALDCGYMKIVKLLIKKGANIHINKEQPLKQASENGNLKMVKFLVDHGANIHANKDIALRLASKNGYTEIVKYLVEHGANIHASKDIALRLASKNGHSDIIKFLVEHSSLNNMKYKYHRQLEIQKIFAQAKMVY
ncbi:MAG: putative ankyrin repeat protein [Satyrvirus sp.]|uniref:Putative ankyrin repeat protein n=1 Tax=Satyrvirus sp. TaxID=2487771 RepID=A0A3G5AE18_9VIRU|nr:MAG: putative ankyrin repeat protein [Satyrvirus sp.]